MGHPYPYELRSRVMKSVESGMKKTEIIKIFQLSKATLYKWIGIKKATGDIKLKTGYQKGHSHKLKNLEEFENFIKANKDRTLKELSKMLQDKGSSSTIGRWLRKIGYSYKKNSSTSQKRCWGKG